MIPNLRAIPRLAIAGALALGLASILLPAPSLARDGVNGCSIAEAEGESGPVWRYTIDVQVPAGGHCRVFIVEDRDRKSWTYCWLKPATANPVSETCDDPIDDRDFDNWKAKAVCGDQSFVAYCRRAVPLQPSR